MHAQACITGRNTQQIRVELFRLCWNSFNFIIVFLLLFKCMYLISFIILNCMYYESASEIRWEKLLYVQRTILHYKTSLKLFLIWVNQLGRFAFIPNCLVVRNVEGHSKRCSLIRICENTSISTIHTLTTSKVGFLWINPSMWVGDQ